jgi:hypothetical protein
MADSINANILIPDATWVDLTATYGTLANAQSWVQNRGANRVVLAYSSSGSAPTAGGYALDPGGTFGGNAAHIWASAPAGPATLSAGIV